MWTGARSALTLREMTNDLEFPWGTRFASIKALAQGDFALALAHLLPHAKAVVAARDKAREEARKAADRASHSAYMAECYGVRRVLPASVAAFAAPQVIDLWQAAVEAATSSAAADTAEAAAAVVEALTSDGPCGAAAMGSARADAQRARHAADRVAHLLWPARDL